MGGIEHGHSGRTMPRRNPSRCVASASVASIWILLATVGLLACAGLPVAESFAVSVLPSCRPSRSQCNRLGTSLRSRCPTSRLLLSNDDQYDDPRDDLGRSIRGLQSSALKATIEPGDTVVCKRSLPNLGIYENASYEVKSIYAQSFDDEMQQVVKRPLGSLDVAIDAAKGEKLYMTLYSPQYHPEGAVVVTPEEVGLVSVREELGNAVWLAVPGFFWVFVASSFFNTYHERTGGSFVDAFFGR